MIPITDSIALDERELQLDFVRASGPGGQNVNKVSTAVQLRFDVVHSPSLPEDVRQRLARLVGRRLTADGLLVIDARRFRTQEQNRQDAIRRLVQLIRLAARPPKQRKPTIPTTASRLRRLEVKRKRRAIKQMRQKVSGLDE